MVSHSEYSVRYVF